MKIKNNSNELKINRDRKLKQERKNKKFNKLMNKKYQYQNIDDILENEHSL